MADSHLRLQTLAGSVTARAETRIREAGMAALTATPPGTSLTVCVPATTMAAAGRATLMR